MIRISEINQGIKLMESTAKQGGLQLGEREGAVLHRSYIDRRIGHSDVEARFANKCQFAMPWISSSSCPLPRMHPWLRAFGAIGLGIM